jgi:hypothetical protein
MNPNDDNVRIAEALGLPIKHLVSVTLQLRAHELPTVTAVYHLWDDAPLREVLTPLSVNHQRV